MTANSYFPNYFSIEDIFVTNEKVDCKVNTQLSKMGFLDSSLEEEDLLPGRTINLPIWYINELKSNNPYFKVILPEIYKNVHKAVCEADTTHIELGKLHPYFYEYGRYLVPYDSHHIMGKIIFETLRQRIRYLLDISKNSITYDKPEHRLDDIENKLYNLGVKTNILYVNWLKMKGSNLSISNLVQEHSRKRKYLCDDEDASALKIKRFK